MHRYLGKVGIPDQARRSIQQKRQDQPTIISWYHIRDDLGIPEVVNNAVVVAAHDTERVFNDASRRRTEAYHQPVWAPVFVIVPDGVN
jgi:hypothetical protein